MLEILFLIAGIWVIISGKIPSKLFSFLFGKGEYKLSPRNTRLFGLLLSSPLPVSFMVAVLLSALMGSEANGYGVAFEIVYLIVVIIASIVIARKARVLVIESSDNSTSTETSGSENKSTRESSYGKNILILFGIVILGCITATAVFSVITVVVSTFAYGTSTTGNFREDVLPFIIMLVISGLGTFGIVKLVQILRRS